MRSAGGALFGIMCSPDWDVDNGNISGTIIKNRLGKAARKVWDVFLWPYATSFKHGRFASHFPAFGTLVRLFYIFFTTILPITILIKLLVLPKLDLILELAWWCKMVVFEPWFVFGLMYSDLIHFVLDILTTEHKDVK